MAEVVKLSDWRRVSSPGRVTTSVLLTVTQEGDDVPDIANMTAQELLDYARSLGGEDGR